jgi:hypothetical protein
MLDNTERAVIMLAFRTNFKYLDHSLYVTDECMLITVTTLLSSISFCVNLIVRNYYAAALRVPSNLLLPYSSLSCLG